MRVWACANQKGGVGKTTTAVALGGLLAEKKRRVLLIDFDPHASLTSYFGYDSDELDNTSFDLFDVSNKSRLGQVISDTVIKTEFEHLHILPGSLALATLDKHLAKLDGMGLVLKRALTQVEPNYDQVIIDCPPIVGILMINALATCQHLVIPVQTEFLAIKGLERMLRTIKMVIKAQHHNLSYTILPTMYDRRTRASIQSLQLLKETYPNELWDGIVPVDTAFRDASKAGKPPSIYNKRMRGVHAYENFLNYLIAHQVKHDAQTNEAV